MLLLSQSLCQSCLTNWKVIPYWGTGERSRHPHCLSLHTPLCLQFVLVTNISSVGSGYVLQSLEKTHWKRLGGVITYVKQLSDVQSTENSSELPHVPSSSSSSCRKPLLCFSCVSTQRLRFEWIFLQCWRHKRLGQEKAPPSTYPPPHSVICNTLFIKKVK